MRLSTESLAATVEARDRLAHGWKPTFFSGGGKHEEGSGSAAGTKTRRKRRNFRLVSKLVKSKAAKVTKTVTQKAPPGKLKKSQEKAIEDIPQNLTRCEKGDRLLKQKFRALVTLDAAAFAKKPMFEIDGTCRIQSLDANMFQTFLYGQCMVLFC